MLLHGQVCQALHREGLHDSAVVFQIASKNRHNNHEGATVKRCVNKFQAAVLSG